MHNRVGWGKIIIFVKHNMLKMCIFEAESQNMIRLCNAWFKKWKEIFITYSADVAGSKYVPNGKIT